MVLLVDQGAIYALLEKLEGKRLEVNTRFVGRDLTIAEDAFRAFRYALVEWLTDNGAKVTP